MSGQPQDGTPKTSRTIWSGLEPLNVLSVHNLSDEELDALEYASFGTIGDTIEERRHFWNALEAIEQDPQGDEVKSNSPTFLSGGISRWQNLETAPTQLKTALEAQRQPPANPRTSRIKAPDECGLSQSTTGL